MKKVFFFISFSFCFNSVFCQFKEIDKRVIYKSRTNAFFTFSDSLLVDGQGSLETERLRLYITKAKVNKQTNELMLEGRVCESADTNYNCNFGSPNTLIFKGTKKGNVVTDTIRITKTSSEKQNHENEGFFNLVIKMRKNEFIYFYNARFYVEEFSVKKIMRSLKLVK